ncbi:gag-asp_proteas domain-containing protein, partial [Cephalotus follicularis]
VSATVDTGATHSFLAERMVNRLGLRVDKHASRIKAVNSQAQAVAGMTHGVQIYIGDWVGKIDFMVVPLDDFDLILGNDFFISKKVIMMPHLCGLFIMNEKFPVLWQDTMWQRLSHKEIKSRRKHCLPCSWPGP